MTLLKSRCQTLVARGTVPFWQGTAHASRRERKRERKVLRLVVGEALPSELIQNSPKRDDAVYTYFGHARANHVAAQRDT
jgi:hypothetical protein